MVSDKSDQRHKIIADFVESLSEDFEAKLWLLVKIQAKPNSTISEILGVSCTSIMQRGYSFDDLYLILQTMSSSDIIEMGASEQCRLSARTSYDLTNLFNYVAEKVEDTGDTLYDDLVKCGMAADTFLDDKTSEYETHNITIKSNALRDLCISNAFSFGMWISKVLVRLHAISE